mmetsp:Transcript_34842/g.75215  ORF Transcript_34842/g.75215 Transcript_34842/m.75215 type:complete len:201 (-) Transcript_34842:1390-1992(-)
MWLHNTRKFKTVGWLTALLSTVLHGQSNAAAASSLCNPSNLVEFSQIHIICNDFQGATLQKRLKFPFLLIILNHFQWQQQQFRSITELFHVLCFAPPQLLGFRHLRATHVHPVVGLATEDHGGHQPGRVALRLVVTTLAVVGAILSNVQGLCIQHPGNSCTIGPFVALLLLRHRDIVPIVAIAVVHVLGTFIFSTNWIGT